jgi:hypothetical protein
MILGNSSIIFIDASDMICRQMSACKGMPLSVVANLRQCISFGILVSIYVLYVETFEINFHSSN